MPYTYESFKTFSYLVFFFHYFISDKNLEGSLSQDRNSCFMNEEIEAPEG